MYQILKRESVRVGIFAFAEMSHELIKSMIRESVSGIPPQHLEMWECGVPDKNTRS